MYEHQVLKVNMARIFKQALTRRVLGRRFEQIRERLENVEVVRCVPASFYVFACSKDCRHCKEDREYDMHDNRLLPKARSPTVKAQQRTIFPEDHLVDTDRPFLHASTRIHPYEKCYADHEKSDSGTSEQFDRM